MHLLEKLEQNRNLTLEEWQALIQKQSEYQKEAEKRANILREQNFGNRIYVRGLIEFTNYCRNDCYYCGIRKSNQNAERYRLSTEQILECTDTGYELDVYKRQILLHTQDVRSEKNGWKMEKMYLLCTTI